MSTQNKTEISKGSKGDNANFVQVSRAYFKQWRLLTAKNPLATEILMYLVEHMGRTTNAVICSYKTLQEVTGYSRTSVAKSIRILKEDSWVDTVKVGSATAYCINERAFWQASQYQRKYAMFSATVIASESEQPKGFLDKAKEDLKFIPVVKHKRERIITSPSEELPPPDQKDLDFN